jgi:multiple sugar transport system ATP-binding protein
MTTLIRTWENGLHMGSLRIDGLTKVFDTDEGEIVAVDDLDVDIDDGELVVFVGPSGCGKSTTLRCIAGLERVSRGEIVLDGQPVTNRKPKNRNMAMVFQSYALYPHMTARENMGFGLKMTTDLSSEEIAARVEETSRMMGIEDLLEKKPGELSGGQQQRVALGRAIVREPEVFLMDEPLSNLDAKLRTQMRTELQELQQNLGVTTIYVTHDQVEAMTMGDRIAVLNDGELQQIGTPLECYNEPNNEFVAGFIGSPGMNFFDVELVREAGRAVLHHDAFEYELSESVAEDLTGASTSLTLGVRPEDIRLADGDERNAVTADVNVIEPVGNETYVYLEIGDETYTATLEADVLVSSGNRLEVVFPESNLHLFDGQSGETIRNREAPVDLETASLT